MIALAVELEKILLAEEALKTAYLVGGCVRDSLLGLKATDFDVEVFGINYQTLTKILEPYGRVDVVGKSFGVAKLTIENGVTYDFSLPRKDSKSGKGHKG